MKYKHIAFMSLFSAIQGGLGLNLLSYFYAQVRYTNESVKMFFYNAPREDLNK